MPEGGPHFSSVKKAREALREKAFEIYEMQMAIIKAALAEGNFEVAMEANQFLMKHIKDEDGSSIISEDIDKQKQVDTTAKGPQITIGVAIGGLGKALDASPTQSVIEAVKIEPTEE